jgi:predicted metal-dependent hydrolase
MKKLVVDRVVIPYSIAFSEKAMRKRVAIAPSGVRVVLPRGSTEQEGIDFIESVKLRVFRAREKVLDQEKRHLTRTRLHYISGARIPFFDKELVLDVAAGRRRSVQCEANRLVVTVKGAPASAEAEKQVQAGVEAWMREQVRMEAVRVVSIVGKKIGMLPGAIRIKAQKKLWGSCGKNSVINLNWRLGLFPKTVFEYVVVHEMCHLRHMNHSREFWKLVGKVMPGYEEQRKWLTFKSLEP